MAFPRSMSLWVELVEEALGNVQNVHECEITSSFVPFSGGSLVRQLLKAVEGKKSRELPTCAW